MNGEAREGHASGVAVGTIYGSHCVTAYSSLSRFLIPIYTAANGRLRRINTNVFTPLQNEPFSVCMYLNSVYVRHTNTSIYVSGR